MNNKISVDKVLEYLQELKHIAYLKNNPEKEINAIDNIINFLIEKEARELQLEANRLTSERD